MQRKRFGRRKGKPLRNQQVDTIENLLPLLKIDLGSQPPQNLAALFPADVKSIRLEIGFGGGEHLVHRAVENPETGFIGVEPFVNSMAKLLGGVRERELMNIRLYDDDATQLLDWLPEASIDHIDLLYRSWPKKSTGNAALCPTSIWPASTVS